MIKIVEFFPKCFRRFVATIPIQQLTPGGLRAIRNDAIIAALGAVMRPSEMQDTRERDALKSADFLVL